MVSSPATAENVVNVDFAANSAARTLSARERKAADKKFESFASVPLETVPIALLRSDNRYQTPIIESIVENIVENFSLAAVNPPLVSRHSDGTLWVIDGQHTIEGFIRLGRTEIDCKVIDDLSRKDESDLFLIRNDPRSRRKLSKKQSFKAHVESGDPVAVAMNTIFKKLGFVLHGRGPMKIASLPIMEECFGLDGTGRALELTLADADSAWPHRKGSIPALILRAVAQIHFNGREAGELIDQKRLRIALSTNLKAHGTPALLPADFVALVKQTIEAPKVPNSRYMPRLLGTEILEIYNYRLPRENKVSLKTYLDGLDVYAK